MWGSLQVPFEDGFEVMEQNLEIDPHFQEFHQLCVANNIAFYVISAGLKPVLKNVLEAFLGDEEVGLHPQINGNAVADGYVVIANRNRCQRRSNPARHPPMGADLAP